MSPAASSREPFERAGGPRCGSGISRDAAVNGRWMLEVEDLVTGETGTLESFHLFIVSRWD